MNTEEFFKMGRRAKQNELQRNPMYDEEYMNKIRFYPDKKVMALYNAWHEGYDYVSNN